MRVEQAPQSAWGRLSAQPPLAPTAACARLEQATLSAQRELAA
jgi:hypothetical protein